MEPDREAAPRPASPEERTEHPCPACSQSGVECAFACCGEFGEEGCCGNPRPKPCVCRTCQGSAWASSEAILRFAHESGDPQIYALHEAQLVLATVLVGHPARRSRGAKAL